MTTLKNYPLYAYRYWQARIAQAFVRACTHDPEVVLHDALSGLANLMGFRVRYCLRCGAMQIVSEIDDVEANDWTRALKPTWMPRALANVDLMVRPTRTPPLPALPAVETNPAALKAHQEFLYSQEQSIKHAAEAAIPKIPDSTIDNIERLLQAHGSAAMYIKPDGTIETISPDEMRKDWGG